MLDPAISAFLAERKALWLKKKLKSSLSRSKQIQLQQQGDTLFSLEHWLPSAARRAKQLNLVSHPAKFSHPSAKSSSVIAQAKFKADGLLRSGNIRSTPLDALGNAAAMDAFKFLDLQLTDGQNVLQHLEAKTDLIRQQLSTTSLSFESIREQFLSIKQDDLTRPNTHGRIKQVYFPVPESKTGYHLLSILTPSGMMFTLKDRISQLRFSPSAQQAREDRKQNRYNIHGIRSLHDLAVIGFGGTQPQNISALNNAHRGLAFLLPSIPPKLANKKVQPPKENVFKESINQVPSSSHNLILIPHIQIKNANALSSHLTIGFPAMTAWLGAMHFLQRQLADSSFSDLVFSAVAVACHDMDLHTYQAENGHVRSIISTGNPIDRHGKRSPFIEEARCDLNVSLVIEIQNWNKGDQDAFVRHLDALIQSHLKVAGGDILSAQKSQFLQINHAKQFNHLTQMLMPSYVLIERRDLMLKAMQKGEDALDALLNSQLMHQACTQDKQGNITWHPPQPQDTGWIIPIASGFQGLSELSLAQQQRDAHTPHRFAESVLTLGEFKMPIRFQSWHEIAWHYHADLTNQLYLCQQTT